MLLRQALRRASGVLASASQACGLAAPAAQLETQTRSLGALLSLRTFTQQSWAAQSATPAAAESGQGPQAAAVAAAAPPSPWTPTRELKKRKILPKRMQHLLTVSAEQRSAAAVDLRRFVVDGGHPRAVAAAPGIVGAATACCSPLPAFEQLAVPATAAASVASTLAPAPLLLHCFHACYHPPEPTNQPQTLETEREAALAAELQRPTFGPGDVIELKLSVPENKRRVTVFKGICIAKWVLA